MKAHIVGAGLASLAAAAHLIRDGGLLPNNITIYEADKWLGGAMAKHGNPETGYILPTGRIFENEYRCAMELFSMVPSASSNEISIKDEILAFNKRYGYFDKCHLLDRDCNIVRSKHFGLSVRDRLDLVRLTLTPEALLEGKRIDEYFEKEFFETEFWYLWATLMGCLPHHSAMEMRRFINRFLHLVPDLSTMTGILRTKYNQQEAIAEPIIKWLSHQGVKFLSNALVRSVEFKPSLNEITANSLEYVQNGKTTNVEIGKTDVVLITNGSQVADLSIGSMTDAPKPEHSGRSWALWERLAKGREEFGSPRVFFGEDKIPDMKWISFTVTTTGSRFFDLMSELTASEPGRGGLFTLKDSNWIITLALFHHPEFLGQPDNVQAWFGFALTPDKKGNFVKKTMSECSGAEVLEETVRHLKFDKDLDEIAKSSVCIPVVLPYAFSVWATRNRHDRPHVVPKGSTNFGFIGQFAEIPLECVFTMEYSVRTAREAIVQLLGLDREIPTITQGQHNPAVLYEAVKALA